MYKLKNKIPKDRGQMKYPGNANAPASLISLKKGQKGEIYDLNTDDEGILKKILAMGILPGKHIAIIQSYPVMVIQLEEAQLAMDYELARCIIVELKQV